jgi:hypothetical protein
MVVCSILAMMAKHINGAVRILSLLVLVVAAGCSRLFQKPDVEASVRGVLAAYSSDLSSGKPARASLYSRQMKALLQERRGFYGEFFLNALHSDLTSIMSSYEIRSISQDPGRKGVLVVHAAELVDLKGKYRLEPEGHPIVKAAAWAMEHTEDPAERAGLQVLASMYNTAAHYNAAEGYDTAFVLEHSLTIVRRWTGLQIVEDAYTDANPQDNPEGRDVIEWKDGMFARQELDYWDYPDYSMYHMSIEQLGQSLLLDHLK